MGVHPQPCLSLLVLACSSTCSPVKYLGVHGGHSQGVLSPSLYPVRTALDVLQPSIGYGYGHGYGHGYGQGYGYGYGYPWGLGNFALAPASLQSAFLGGFSSVPRVVTAVVDAEEVGLETTVEAAAPIVTIQHTIDALPLPPRSSDSNSKFRNPIPPAIPAGIVQATQPTFGHVSVRT